MRKENSFTLWDITMKIVLVVPNRDEMEKLYKELAAKFPSSDGSEYHIHFDSLKSSPDTNYCLTVHMSGHRRTGEVLDHIENYCAENNINFEIEHGTSDSKK